MFQHARGPIDWPAHTAVTLRRPGSGGASLTAGVLKSEDQVGGIERDTGSLGSATRSNWLALSKAQVATDAWRRTWRGRARQTSRARSSIGSLDCTTPGAPVSAVTIDGSRWSPLVSRGWGAMPPGWSGGLASSPREGSDPGQRRTSRAAIAPAKANGSAPAHR